MRRRLISKSLPLFSAIGRCTQLAACLLMFIVLLNGCGQQTQWVPRSAAESQVEMIEVPEEVPVSEAQQLAEKRMRTWRIQSRLDRQAEAFASLGKTTRSGNELKVNVSDIQFKTGSAELLPQSRQLLKKFAAILKQFPEDNIRISGHTDNVGDDSYNMQLSRARAKAVAEALALYGVARESIGASGFGEERPIASNETAEGKAANRRVELDITVDNVRLAER